jgi:hypothetical protein
VTARPDVSISRVVLTVRASGDVLRLLRDAGALARATRAELSGLFVEEADLLRTAALPFTREVGGTSGAVRSIELPATRLLLERRTAEVRRLLERTATELDVPWSFGVTRGSVVEVAISAASGPGVAVLVPPMPSALERAIGGAATARPTPGQPLVAAVLDGSAAGERALDAALALAGGRGNDVAVVLPAGADHEAILRAAARRLGLATSFPPIIDLGTRPPRLRALVVSAGEPGRALTELRRLQAVAGCPVVLVP